jgi:hypothetical protein
MLCTQNGILGSLRLIATVEEGANKTAAKDVLAEFRKAHELMRQWLFILTILRKFDYATADKVARTKAGEYLDADLAKVLEEKDKREVKREREKEKDRSCCQGKQFKGSHSYQVDFGAGSSNPRGYHGYGVQASRGGRGGSTRGGGQVSTTERRCYVCQSLEHFARNCPNRK